MARKNISASEYPSFDFEPLPPEPVPQNEVEKDESGRVLEMPTRESAHEAVYSGPKFIEKNNECPDCGKLYESEHSCPRCVSDKEKRNYLKKLKIEKKVVPIALTELEAVIERLRNDPKNADIKNNNNALVAKAKIIISTPPGTNYETTPWPPLDN